MNKQKIIIILSILLIVFFNRDISAANLNKKEEDAFYVATKAYQDGFYDISLTLFDRFLKTYVDSDKKLDVFVYIGQCYFFQEKYLKALDQFESLLKTKGAERVKDKVLFWLGEIYAKGRDYEHAAEFYKELIKDYKSSSYLLSAYKSLAGVEMNGGKLKDAIETYRSIRSNFKDSTAAEEAFFGICESYYRMRDYAQLKKEIENFISEYPHSKLLGRVYLYLGEANFYLKQYPQAVSAYAQADENSTDTEQSILAQVGLGWSFLKLKKYDDAERIFSKIPEEDQPLGVMLGRAVLKDGLGEYEQSLALFEKVLSNDKNGEYAPLAYFGKAEALYNLERFDEAIVAYRISLDKIREISRFWFYTESKELRDKIHYGLAWSYLKIGDFRSAQDEFQKVAYSSSDKIFKISALCQLGDTYQDAGEYGKAVEAYQNFLKDYPDSVYNDYVQYQLGMTWLKMKNLDSAILAFRKLLKDYPSSKLMDDVNYFIGVAYFQKGDFSSSKQQLEMFIGNFKDSPYRPQAMFLLGEALSNLSEFKSAIDVFQTVTREFSNLETLRQKAEYETAHAYAQMGNETEANKRLSDFITRYPDSQLSPDIIFWLGEAYFENKDLLLARKYFERLIRNYPNHESIGEAFLQIGLSYLEEGNFDAALRNFQQAKAYEKNGDAAKASLLIGDVYLEKSDWEDALKNYEEAASHEGGVAKTAYVKMAVLYRHNKLLKEAVLAYERALGSQGAELNSEIQFNLAEVLEETGLAQEALEAYLKVSYLYPDDEAWVIKALLRVARIYENKANWPELKAILEKIEKYDVPEAKYAHEKLLWLKEQKAN